MSIGDNVRRYRAARSLSLSEFADRVGLSVADCRLIEDGRRVISSTEIKSICQVLDVSIDALFATNHDSDDFVETEGSMLMPVDELQSLLGKMKD